MEQGTKNTVLLVMDMQEGILGGIPDAKPLLEKVAEAIAIAHNKDIPVIYVVVGFRNGAPEISLNNKSFGAGKERFSGIDMDEFMKIHPVIAPQKDGLVVTKRRISAFTGSDLEVILRALNAQHLVLTGVSTSGVILATLVEAADKDHRLTVLSDCCADADAETHRVLMDKIFIKRANVLTVEEWSKG